jgi:hypothetical protein
VRIGRELRQSLVTALCPPIFDRHVATLGKSSIAEATPKRRQYERLIPRSQATYESDHRHSWLLRARCERPRRCTANSAKKFSSTNPDCHENRAHLRYSVVAPASLRFRCRLL